MSTRSDTTYSAVCSVCETGVRSDDANETIAFFRRHRRVTDHDIELDHDGVGVDVEITDADVLRVVRKLQSTYDSGVPVGIVAAVMDDHDCSIDETIAQIHARRMDGKLYEPVDDHLRAF